MVVVRVEGMGSGMDEDMMMSSDSFVVVEVVGKGGRKSGTWVGGDQVGCGRMTGERVEVKGVGSAMSTSISESTSSSDALESESESELARYWRRVASSRSWERPSMS